MGQNVEKDLVFIDVETPNRRNDRVCAIGIIRTTASGEELGRSRMLIDPEVDFDPVNIRVHGINEFSVHGAPSFAEAWREVGPLLEGARLVAHNASFDLNVLDKTMAAYGIEHGPVEYACTITIATQCTDIQCHKLDSICSALGIVLEDHHDPMADAQACMEVYRALVHDGDAPWCVFVPWALRDDGPARGFHMSESTRERNELIKLAMDVVADDCVTLEEAAGLRRWIEASGAHQHDDATASLHALLTEVLLDGTIDVEEEAAVLDALEMLIDPVAQQAVSDCADLEIEGKHVAVTGDFDFGSRAEVKARLVELGAIYHDSPTQKCHYVIVGAKGSAAYAHGNYGSKIKKVIEWQEKGKPIAIITEEDCPWL